MSDAGKLVQLTIDGQTVEIPPVKEVFDFGTQRHKLVPTTIYDAAFELDKRLPGFLRKRIPVLCHREHLDPVAVCRLCTVDVGRPRLVPACYEQVAPGMDVKTYVTSKRVRQSVKVLTELLMADHPSPCEKQRRHGNCELELFAGEVGMDGLFPRRRQENVRPIDGSSLVIAVDHNACILCDRCVRGCDDVSNNHVIGRMGKGYTARIAFDLDDPMGESSCVACGECMVSCPTGALTHRGAVRQQPEEWKGKTPVSTEELLKLDLFEGISQPFLEFNSGAVVRRHLKKGEIICREGDLGATAFYIERGKVNVLLRAPLRHAKSNKAGLTGFVRKFSTRLVSRKEDTRSEESTQRFINTADMPVVLNYDHPVATLQAGDIFGEMTCMSNYPRSATVQAAEDVTVLEMLRNVLYILQRSKKSKALLDQRYKERALDNHLRSFPVFSSLLEDEAEFQRFVQFMRSRVELVRLDPGKTIFRQGDPADNFYLVRIGFVKVSQNLGGGEHVLTYLGPGKYFGEIGLLTHIPEVQALTRPGVRTATCSSLDHVDLVKMAGEHFHELLDAFPQVKQEFIQVALKHLEENEVTQRTVANQSLGEFLQQGLFNARSLLVLDLHKCTRCDECTKACADAHDGVTRLIREGLRFDKYLVASSCRSCLDPYCMVGCPVDAIHRGLSREMTIEDWCIGCGRCSENCPYGNINMHTFADVRGDVVLEGVQAEVRQQKATMCDLCVDLDGQPSCVYACPHDAAHRLSGPELIDLVSGQVPSHPFSD